MIVHGTDFYIGLVTRATPEAQRFVQVPDAPANYKKADAIAAYQTDALNKFLDAAAQYAITGSVTEAAVLDAAGKLVFHSLSPVIGQTSRDLVEWLSSPVVGFEEYPRTVSATFSSRRRLWGIDADRDLRIAGIEALKDPRLDVPLRLWWRNGGVYDPYEMLTGSAERRIIGLEGLALYFDLALPANTDAAAKAEFARRLVARAQLTPSDPFKG